MNCRQAPMSIAIPILSHSPRSRSACLALWPPASGEYPIERQAENMYETR
jgi:hypothetical protein